jgi:hypothetical protein
VRIVERIEQVMTKGKIEVTVMDPRTMMRDE